MKKVFEVYITSYVTKPGIVYQVVIAGDTGGIFYSIAIGGKIYDGEELRKCLSRAKALDIVDIVTKAINRCLKKKGEKIYHEPVYLAPAGEDLYPTK